MISTKQFLIASVGTWVAAGMLGEIEANAATILPFNSEIVEPANALITESGSLADATDDDLLTGYLVTSSSNPANNGGITGFAVRWDFDVSNYTSIDEFTFSVTGTMTNPFALDDIWIGYQASCIACSSAQDTDSGVSSVHTITATPGGLSFQNLSEYVSGGVLSVFVQTEFGFTSQGGPISYLTQEVSLDITGTVAEVPLPAAAWFLLSALGGLGFAGWRRRKVAA